MKELIQANGGMIAIVVGVLMAYNVLMTAVKVVLEMFKDKTPTDVDNKVYDWISKSLSFVMVAIDWLSSNKEHK